MAECEMVEICVGGTQDRNTPVPTQTNFFCKIVSEEGRTCGDDQEKNHEEDFRAFGQYHQRHNIHQEEKHQEAKSTYKTRDSKLACAREAIRYFEIADFSGRVDDSIFCVPIQAAN